MNKYKYYLFDLDGTISESALGIRESLENAIKSMGKPLPNLDDYTLYIGPPLLDTFRNICRFNEEESARGVEIYREYYNTKGKLVNKLYDGIDRVLAELKNSGAKLAVCSSKYEKFAEEITDLLGVHDMFDAICGSTLDGSRKDKKDLIPYAVERLGGSLENDRENIVMIGDTWFDTKGARLCGVDFVGVEYGYGDLESMKKDIGVVSSIVGEERYMVTVHGRENHAGTTPMKYRDDALIKASKMMLSLNEKCKEIDDTMVVTVGWIKAFPGEQNIIPGKVQMKGKGYSAE